MVNNLEDNIATLSGNFPSFEYVQREGELKELLGHQPVEVIAGSILGVVLGLISAKIENDERKQPKYKHTRK